MAGKNSGTTLQIHRHTPYGFYSEDKKNELGDETRDQFYLVINGLHLVERDDEKFPLKNCFASFQLGLKEVTDDYDPTQNHAKCAAWDKNFY